MATQQQLTAIWLHIPFPWTFTIGHLVVPTETTTSFATGGPYRFSRGPMYLGLFLLFVGLSSIAT